MIAVVGLLYAVFLIVAGIEGNAPTVAHLIGQEGQFLYWVVVILVILALWDSNVAEELAKPLALLIVIGWLLHKNNGVDNWKTLADNTKALLPAL